MGALCTLQLKKPFPQAKKKQPLRVFVGRVSQGLGISYVKHAKIPEQSSHCPPLCTVEFQDADLFLWEKVAAFEGQKDRAKPWASWLVMSWTPHHNLQEPPVVCLVQVHNLVSWLSSARPTFERSPLVFVFALVIKNHSQNPPISASYVGQEMEQLKKCHPSKCCCSVPQQKEDHTLQRNEPVEEVH